MPQTHHGQHSLVVAFLLTSLLTVIFTFYLLGLTAVGLVHWSSLQLNQFLAAANITPLELTSLGYAGWTKTPKTTENRKNILVLGLDSLSTRGDSPALTDTIIIMSIQMDSGKINAVSFPRDLWIPEQQSRVNALYYYGQGRYPTQPQRFSQEVISQLINLEIHHTVVLTLEEVAELIDMVGGISVDVPVAFTDTQFPRSDVDVTVERDPAKLYKTVEFEAGVQTLNGERALEYIRSRKSEGEAGGDGARVNRQQQVIAALLKKITQPSTFTKPAQAGQLFAFYNQRFAKFVPITEAIATVKALWPVRNEIEFIGHSLTIYPDNQDGALIHPPETQYFGQWVYVVRDQEIFSQEIKTALQLP